MTTDVNIQFLTVLYFEIIKFESSSKQVIQ